MTKYFIHKINQKLETSFTTAKYTTVL